MKKKNAGAKVTGRSLLAILAAASMMCMSACGSNVPGGPVNSGIGTDISQTEDNGGGDQGSTETDPGNTDADQAADADQNAGSDSEVPDVDTDSNAESQSAVDLSESGQPLTDHTWFSTEGVYNSRFDDGYEKYLIGSQYELLHMSPDAASLYPELDKALSVANDLIATEQENLFIADGKAVDDMTAEEINNALYDRESVRGKKNELFIRRADDEVLSFVSNTYAVESIEIQQRMYRAFNYDVKTGMPIELGEIVKDLDKFNDILVTKAIDAVAIPDFGVYPEDIDRAEMLKNINLALESEQACWTLDPNGITFYFNTGAIAYPPREVRVLFSDDPNGEIFTGKYAEPDNWIVYLDGYTDFGFRSPDGKDHVAGAGAYDYGGYEENWGTSIYIYYDGISAGFENEEGSGDKFALVRKGDKYWVYDFHSTYVYPALDIYSIDGGDIQLIQNLTMSPAGFSRDYEGLGYFPNGVLTDATNVTLAVRTDVISTCYSNCRFTIGSDGMLTQEDEIMDIEPTTRYTLAPNFDLPDVPIVDESGTITGETTDITNGENLTMIRTDGKYFVDMTRDNGETVRLNIIWNEDEYSKKILTSEGEKETYEVFDDMMFAQ